MTLVRSSIVFTAAQFALLITGLVSSIVISRWLGPDGRGVVALVAVITTSATALATFGLGSAYAFLAGKGSYAHEQIVGSIVVSSLTLGVLTFAVLVALSSLLRDSLLRGMTSAEFFVTAASIPFVFLVFFLLNFLIGAGQAVRAAWMQLVGGLFTAAMIIVAVVIGDQGVAGVVVITALTTGLVALGYLAIVIRRYGLSFRSLKPIGSAVGSYGARAYLGTLSSQFWLRADVLILNFYAGPTAVGEYSVATNIAEQVWILDTSISQVILHDVIRSPTEEAGRLVAKTSRNVLFVSGIVCVMIAVLAPWLIPFLFGNKFESAVVPLWLLLPGVLAIATARPLSSYFSGQLGKPQITSAVSVVTAVVGVGAYLALVPPLEASGAAIGSSLAYIMPLVAYIPLFRRLTGIVPREVLVINRDDVRMYGHVVRSALGSADPGPRAQSE